MNVPSAMAGAVSLAALACIATPPAAIAGPARDGAVGRVCAGTLGLDPGEKHYAACVQSLSGSLANSSAGQGMANARRACAARGLRPGAEDFDECELRLADAAPAPASVRASAPAAGGRSYFESSRGEAWKRDELACARLGFDPAGTAFQACVGNLRGALARASMPAM
ncbi:MAG TPA: hypothetical protein VN694_14195 [Caulobacteraceae bacterium]|nr:hypothetical protein [Caulobacteraceae bacterium]